MQGGEFRRWAARGTRHYGDDPWQFVRELLQNARDAGARHVQVRTAVEAGDEVLSVEDDGAGMTLEHARRYLFRLYASSKDPRGDSAGEFGIGFWTVLRFAPTRLTIASRCDDDAWAIEVDGSFALRAVSCPLERPGTRITLRRPVRTDVAALRAVLRAALEHYGRCLSVRGAPRQALTLDLDGVAVRQGLGVDSPLGLRFEDGPVRGVVGLGPEPSVTLYARGLPVWQGAVLDELGAGPAPRRYRGEVAQGLAPVFVLDGRRLRVDVQRRGVVDDRHLRAVRRAAERALARLVRGHLRQGVLRAPGARLRAWLGALWDDHLRPQRGPLALVGLALAIALGVLWWAGPRLRARWSGPGVAAPVTAGEHATALAAVPALEVPALDVPGLDASPGSPLPERYFGAVVDGVAPAVPLLRYRPSDTRWFRVLVVETHDVARGFVGDVLAGPRQLAPALRCTETCGEVRLATPRRTWLPLPVPAGTAVDPDSVVDSEGSALALWRTTRGEVLLEREAPGEEVRYTVGAVAEPTQLAAAARARLLALPPDLPWPPAWRDALAAGRSPSVARRVQRVRELVQRTLVYDAGAALARRYVERPPDRPWLTHVLALGRGDCDVINGVAVLLLRELGLPARLVIGYVGQGGVVRSGLHAWAEYHDRGWQRLDLTEAVAHAGASGAAPPIVASARPAFAPDPGARSVEDEAPARLPRATDAMLSTPARAHAAASTSARASIEPHAGSERVPPGERSPTVAALPRPRGVDATTRQARHARAWLAWLPGAALLGGLAWWRRRRRRWTRLEQRAQGEADAAQVLAHMLQSALVQPAAWQQARELFHAPALPLVGGGAISLHQAVRRAARRRLFLGRPGLALAELARRSGVPVLDASHPQLGPVARMLDGALDLERLADLQPLPAAQGGDPALRALRDHVQRTLAAAGLRDLPLCFVASARAGSFRDVDLENLRLPATSAWPRRYIAIDVADRFWAAAAVLHARAPTRACYLVLHHLLQASLFTVPVEAELRREVSRALLREASA